MKIKSTPVHNEPYKLTDKLPFGKFKGVLLSDIIKEQPEYIEWCMKNIPTFQLSNDAKDYLEVVIFEYEMDSRDGYTTELDWWGYDDQPF